MNDDEALEAVRGFGPVEQVVACDGLEGIRSLYLGADFTAMVATPARAEAEARGARAGHPLAPRWVASAGPAWAIERVGAMPPEPVEALLASYQGETVRIERSLGELLLQDDVAPGRGLARCGIPQRRIDRALRQSVAIELEVGPTLGGASVAWLRTNAAGAAVSLVMRRADREGWPISDLAAMAVRGEADASQAFVAHAQARDRSARERAWRVALLRSALREAVVGRSSAAVGVVLEQFASFDHHEPLEVELVLDAPPMLDRSRYAPVEGKVPASHARFLMRVLDGVVLGGVPIRVSTTPHLRSGRVTRPFEALRARLERVLGHPDARFDEEGLYSATPVVLAREVVQGLSGVVIDATAGLGCLTIAAAERPEVSRVIAIELDRTRLAMAKELAVLRGVADKITWLHGDARALLPTLAGDALIADPPWGGRDYDRGAVKLDELPLDVGPLVSRFSGAVRLKLPRGLDVRSLPVDFSARAMIDEHGVIKFLLAFR